MTEPIDPQAYKQLIDELCTLYETTLVPSVEKNKRTLRSYWKMGKRIQQELARYDSNKRHGKQLLLNISNDLSQKYGDGLKERTVRYINNFATVYVPTQLNPALSWSHYRALLSVKDKNRRLELEQHAIEKQLTKDALIQLISQQRPKKQASPCHFPLAPRAASVGIYKVTHDAVSKTVLLDLGFNVKKASSLPGISSPQSGMYVTQQRSNKFKQVNIQPGERYCYRAQLLTVIDGDTIRVRIDLGFHCFIDEKLRLRGVDAMEIDSPEGQKAKRALTRLLRNSNALHVFTYSYDKFGRYIADVIIDEHIYINKKLVESGHARFLKM